MVKQEIEKKTRKKNQDKKTNVSLEIQIAACLV